MKRLSEMEVAIAHYWFVTHRGGERVVSSLLKLFPRADIYTLFFDREKLGSLLEGHEVTSSILDLPFLRSRHQQVFPLYPTGVRSLMLRKKYDLLISSESGPIKGIPNPQDIPHICYAHTPMRYCWGFEEEYLARVPALLRPAARLALAGLRHYDRGTGDAPGLYVANSRHVAGRIRAAYGREATVCHPPIRDELFNGDLLKRRQAGPSTRDYYLSLGAVTPYKRIDLLVDAFNQCGKKLVIVGAGSEARALKARSAPNIEWHGELPWRDIEPLILGSRALLFPGEEDFGMVPLEVMAHGVPVIAYGKGGALETVVHIQDGPEKSSGIFFGEQTVAGVLDALAAFEKTEAGFDPAFIVEHARQFSEGRFLREFSDIVSGFLGGKNISDGITG